MLNKLFAVHMTTLLLCCNITVDATSKEHPQCSLTVNASDAHSVVTLLHGLEINPDPKVGAAGSPHPNSDETPPPHRAVARSQHEESDETQSPNLLKGEAAAGSQHEESDDASSWKDGTRNALPIDSQFLY